MLLKLRASVSSEVNGGTRVLSAADAQGTLDKTASISVFLRAGLCPVLTELVLPLERQGSAPGSSRGRRSRRASVSWSGALGTTRSGPEDVVCCGWSGGLNTRVCVQGFLLNSVLAFDA